MWLRFIPFILKYLLLITESGDGLKRSVASDRLCLNQSCRGRWHRSESPSHQIYVEFPENLRIRDGELCEFISWKGLHDPICPAERGIDGHLPRQTLCQFVQIKLQYLKKVLILPKWKTAVVQQLKNLYSRSKIQGLHPGGL